MDNQPQDPFRKIEALILRDECVAKLEDCRPGCNTDTGHLCKHRFDVETHVEGCSSYISFLRFFDFQIILHFAYLIERNKFPMPLSEDCKFIIFTKDRNFLADSESIWTENRSFLERVRLGWSQRSRRNTHPVMEFKDDCVILRLSLAKGEFAIYVQEIASKNYGTNGESDQRKMIEQLNRFMKKS